MIKVIIPIVAFSLLTNCQDSDQQASNTSNRMELVPEPDKDLREKYEKQIKENQINNEAGPPFSDSCDCSFEYLGGFKSGKNRYDLLISGKGWNPNYWSCTYTFGEIINNEFPPDTTITDFRIHLVDLATIKKLDAAIFNSSLIQKNTIATQRFTPEDAFKCHWDPIKTGKYTKPNQWSD